MSGALAALTDLQVYHGCNYFSILTA